MTASISVLFVLSWVQPVLLEEKGRSIVMSWPNNAGKGNLPLPRKSVHWMPTICEGTGDDR